MGRTSLLTHIWKCSNQRSSNFMSKFLNSCEKPTLLTARHLTSFQSKAVVNGSAEKKCFVAQPFYNYSSSSLQEVKVSYRFGLPVVSVPLPSRQELCNFTLRPVSSTVGDFIDSLKQEDKGIDRAIVYSTDGCRVAASTQIEHLLNDKFLLKINDNSYTVDPPALEHVTSESSVTLDDAKSLISHLYTQLHIDQHQLTKERELIARVENLKVELEPLQKIKTDIAQSASKKTRILLWGGLAAMGLQFGILARLTWFEYSWDIMEPVTYFITYGTAIIMYGYFVLTQQEYIYPDARDRQYLRFFHKTAKKSEFDVEKYNKLCDEIALAEQDLRRLRDPLQLQLPIDPIRLKEAKELNQP